MTHDPAVRRYHRSFVLMALCAAASMMTAPRVCLAQNAADRTDPNVTNGTVVPRVSMDRLRYHVPDPDLYRPEAVARLEQLRKDGDRNGARYLERVLERVDAMHLPNTLFLSLEEVLHRTLVNSFAIKTQGFNPAIETTRVVEAESEFDSVFFTNINVSNIDRPSGSALASTSIQQFTSSYGIRKQLASGTQVSATWNLNRTKTVLSFQQINPEYTSNVAIALRQPFLRGFGIDFNRSQIMLAQNTESTSHWAFHRQIRDTLRNAEELYWRLVQARRDVVITARLLGDFEQIYEYLKARESFDVIPVQLNDTKANLEQALADFIQRKQNVADARDRLLAVMNDPDVPIGGDLEIIPSDFPQLMQIVVDPLAESQTALDFRPEIKEQEFNIANAKIVVDRAKNLEMPRLDATFRYQVDGLAGNADRAFDQMSGNNFISYFVGVEFEIPTGNRGPRAAHKRAKLQFLQAEAALRDLFEQIILDVNVSARTLHTTYDQILPNFESVEARHRQVESLVARAERKDFNTLNTELNARQSLANSRRAMLNAIVEFNIAVIDLERAKGTLLRYNNVVIPVDGE